MRLRDLFNDTYRGNCDIRENGVFLNSVQEFIEIEALPLLAFFLFLHN